MCDKSPRPECLIQSYVRDRYFVSTAKRVGFAGSGPPFFETMAWEWDRATDKRGAGVKTGSMSAFFPYAASDTQDEALLAHAAVCAELAGRCEPCKLKEESRV
ncbi:MAG TPA: hypothetical protein VJP77_05790 [Planctomycetota bacterium]|nr:hypothetical protein [Planctomycetota bacterium]